MTEDEAVLRCQNGDREAFRYLVEQYKHPLFGTAYLMTGNAAQAEEHVQDAFLLAWRGIRTFRRGSSVKPWLMRILVNAVISQQRKRRLATVPPGGIDPAGSARRAARRTRGERGPPGRCARCSPSSVPSTAR